MVVTWEAARSAVCSRWFEPCPSVLLISSRTKSQAETVKAPAITRPRDTARSIETLSLETNGGDRRYRGRRAGGKPSVAGLPQGFPPAGLRRNIHPRVSSFVDKMQQTGMIRPYLKRIAGLTARDVLHPARYGSRM